MIKQFIIGTFFIKIPRYISTHLGNTFLVDDTSYNTCLKMAFNAIFVESYEDLPKEDNYFMKTFLAYLEFLHYFGLSVRTFVGLYPFSTIISIKEDNVKFWTLFEKCAMACHASFCRNHLTSLVNSPKFIFCSFLPILSWIF